MVNRGLPPISRIPPLGAMTIIREVCHGEGGEVRTAWLKQFDQDPDNPYPGKGKMRPEEAELFRLKRELMKVTAERDILKKRSRTSRRTPSEVRLRGTLAQCLACSMDGQGTRRVGEWVLRVVEPAREQPLDVQSCASSAHPREL